MFGNLFGGSGSKSGSKASVSAPGACPRRRPRGSRDDVRSAFRPVRGSWRTISCISRDAAPFRAAVPTRRWPRLRLFLRTHQASAPGPTAVAASGASAAPRV